MKIFLEEENVKLILSNLRESTINQYQSSWKTFCSWFREENHITCSLNEVLSFLNYLLKVKKYASATIVTYKSALADPLSLGFGIDFSSQWLSKATAALYKIKPVLPQTRVSWSLQKTLETIKQEVSFNKTPLEIATMHTAFLLAIALGSRIGELQALCRDYVKFSGNEVVLFPNPIYLKKNEREDALREQLRIKGLPSSCQKLCPVYNLKKYLDLTSESSCDFIFVDPKKINVRLSKKKLATLLCNFIKLANPGSIPKSHDTRKMATSMAFMGSMTMEDIAKFTGWKSENVFQKHYFHPIRELISDVVVLGRPL